MTTTVKPGQVWADNDGRHEGRTLRVDSIDGDKAVCTTLTNDAKTQRYLDNPDTLSWYRPDDRRGKPTRIRIDRFKPTSTGYRLVSEATA